MLAYLCGPADSVSDCGKLWRRKLTPFLHNELGHRVYDPADDARKNLTDEESVHYKSWKDSDLGRFRRGVRKIMQYELDIVENKADYVICCLDGVGAVASSGTFTELAFACRRGIPVYLVTEAPLSEIGGRTLACADRLFSNVEELKRFLLERYGKEKQAPPGGCRRSICAARSRAIPSPQCSLMGKLSLARISFAIR